MKTLITIFLLTILSINNHALGSSWTQKADFPGTERFYPVSFAIGNKGYVGTGSDASFSTRYNDLWEWDEATNTWTQKASLPPSEARVGSVAFSIGTKGYIGTGFGSGTVGNDFWEWDQATNVWTKKTTLPGASRYDAAAFSIGTKGYIGTGSGPLKDFWEWDQATDKWTKKADLPGAARLGAACFSIGTKGYIGIGTAINFTVFYKDFWEWDQATNKWTQKNDFPGGARYYGLGFAISSNGYIGTGIDSINKVKQDLWKWDQATNSWTKQEDFPGGPRAFEGGSGAFVIGNNAYFATGIDNTNTLYNDFWEFSPNSDFVIPANLDNNNIKLFPNPSTGIIIVHNQSANILHVTITNMLGENVMEISHPNAPEFTLDLSKLPPGIYFARFMMRGEVIERKIVRN